MWLRKLFTRPDPPMPTIAPLAQTTIDDEYTRQRDEIDLQIEALVDLANARLRQADDQHKH